MAERERSCSGQLVWGGVSEVVGVEKARLEGSEAEARWGGVLGRWRAGML